MRIDARLGRLALGLVCFGPTTSACAPPCYDDGVLQSGCPTEVETDSNSGAGTMSGTTTGTNASADGTGESGIMTAEGSATDTGGSSSGGVQCPGFQGLLAPETRTFELVVEQSGSMTLDLDGVSRYDAVAEALFDPMNGAVTAKQATTRFGMLLYRGLQAGCPITESEPPMIDAAPALAGLMAANPPSGSNPVPNSIDEAALVLAGDPADGDKTLVLIFGNEPGSCDIQTPVNAVELASTRAATVDAITAAYEMGFETRVVSIDSDIDGGFLQLVANAGIGHQPADPDAMFWVAQDRPELAMAIDEITFTSRACDFALDEPISAELAPDCEVVVNGAAVMYEDPDGWDLPDDQTLELSGTACDSIQQGLATINMTCSCNA